jgi:hypothetical protein
MGKNVYKLKLSHYEFFGISQWNFATGYLYYLEHDSLFFSFYISVYRPILGNDQ